jgi:hypothetical protein
MKVGFLGFEVEEVEGKGKRGWGQKERARSTKKSA